MWAWGHNTDGQLGDGTKTNRKVPVRVGLPAKAVQVEAGAFYSLALLDDNTVYAWGSNPYGELGDGSRTSRSIPVKAKLPDGIVIKSLGALSPQSHTSFAITTDNRIYGWGSNAYGETGNGRSGDGAYVSTPTLSSYSFSAMATGSSFVVGLDADGKIWAWGSGSVNRLGNGSTANRTSPRAVSMPANVRTVQIEAGNGFGVARDDSGRIYTWGYLAGNNTTRATPALMSTLSATATSVSAGAAFACASMANGDVYCWGRNTYRQLQDGTTTDKYDPVLSWADRSIVISSLGLGEDISFAVAKPGENDQTTNIWAWGINTNGERGDGTASGNTRSPAPTQVKGPVGCAEGTVADGAGTCVAKSGTTYTLTYLFRSWLSPVSTVTK